MNTNAQINYNDVDTFPKFARVTVRILIEILKTLMKKNEAPILMVGGKHIYLQEHVMKIFGFGQRKERQLRANGEIEYMISKNGTDIFYFGEHIEDYIARNFVSSKSSDGARIRKQRTERFKNTEVKIDSG